MFGSTILEVVIGVIFIIVVFSTICAAVREIIEAFMKMRAAYLERGIRELLSDPNGSGLASEIFNHPLVHGLFLGNYAARSKDAGIVARNLGGNLPSYIPARNFALALLDVAAHGKLNAPDGSTTPLSVDSLRQTLGKIDNPMVSRVLVNALDLAGQDVNKVVEQLELWFDSGMDRVAGWYKRSTGYILFLIAFILAASMNVNIVRIADYLYRNDYDRTILVGQARTLVQDPKLLQDNRYVIDRMRNATFPIGWDDAGKASNAASNAASNSDNDGGLLYRLCGWFITALAAMLGAPFWFDVLNKIMVIRSTVKPHEKSPEEPSNDRKT